MITKKNNNKSSGKKKTQNNILVIGDAHVTNGQSLRRFDWLAQYIERQEDLTHVVIIGDFLTYNSLSAWDRDKRLLMEGRRLSKEVDAGHIALEKLNKACIQISCNRIYIEGNHEDRLRRYIETHPELADGNLTTPSLLSLEELGWEWIPYRSYRVINGIHFTHIPFGKSREISGKDICSKAESVTTSSVVFGHTHELHTSCVHKHGMKHLQQILNVGCFFEQDEEYVEGKMTNYWKGVVKLKNYDYGRFDIETTSMGALQRGYNKD